MLGGLFQCHLIVRRQVVDVYEVPTKSPISSDTIDGYTKLSKMHPRLFKQPSTRAAKAIVWFVPNVIVKISHASHVSINEIVVWPFLV